MAGKTGTAQKINTKTHSYDDEKLVVSFCGFFPVKRPKLTILVVYDEPQKDAWGGVCAAPVFKNIARHIATYLNIPSDILPSTANQAQIPVEHFQNTSSNKILQEIDHGPS